MAEVISVQHNIESMVQLLLMTVIYVYKEKEKLSQKDTSTLNVAAKACVKKDEIKV